MCELLELTDDEKSVLKVGVTVAFAERYGFTYASVADYFERKHVFDFIDLHSGLLVTKMYEFVAEIGRDLIVIGVKSGKHREAPSLSKVPSVFKVDRRVMFEDTNIRISEDGVEHYPLNAAAFMDSMSDPIDIDSLMWTEPLDFDMV